MKFTIDRSKWLCGTGKGVLCDQSGMMCVFGQVLEQLGIPQSEMINQYTPLRFWNRHPAIKSFLSANGLLMNGHANSVLIWNDDECDYVDDVPIAQQREHHIRRLFSEMGHEIEFVGEFPA